MGAWNKVNGDDIDRDVIENKSSKPVEFSSATFIPRNKLSGEIQTLDSIREFEENRRNNQNQNH